jgi:hypothetical protein
MTRRFARALEPFCLRLWLFYRFSRKIRWYYLKLSYPEGISYGLTHVIGTPKFMASTGVFVRVVRALKHSIKDFPSATSMILT